MATSTPEAVAARSDGAASTDSAARVHLIVASFFLVIAGILALATALQLVWPDFLGGVGALSYGRLRPMGTNTFLFGWLTLAQIGALYYVLPRVTGRSLFQEKAAVASAALVSAGLLGGIYALAISHNKGRQYLEFTLWANALIFLGLVVAAIVATRTVAAAGKRPLGSAAWFLVGASWWAVLVFLAGAIPRIPGINSAIQTAFFLAGYTGLFLAAGGVGVLYYLIPAITGKQTPAPSRLTLVAFWSLAFAWSWTGQRVLVFGPGPDWLETVAIAFSIALVVPVLAILVDLAGMLRGRWEVLKESVPLQFALAGAALFGLLPFIGMVSALRSSSSVIGLTAAAGVYEQVALWGVFTLWLAALVHFVLPGRIRAARIHLLLTLSGVVLTAFAYGFAGMQQGLTWIGAANSMDFVNSGDGFRNSVGPLAGMYFLAVVGIALFLVGQLVFVAGLVRAKPRPDRAVEAADDVVDPAPPMDYRRLLAGTVGVFALAALFALVLPGFESSHSDGTLLGDTGRVFDAGSLEAKGRTIYMEQGCWYCHTQQVRPIVGDVGLGPVSAAGDYVNETPALVGVQRIGPDLMHVGSREPAGDVAWLIDHLRAPRRARPWSIMPAYDFLGDDDLRALATYLAGLE